MTLLRWLAACLALWRMTPSKESLGPVKWPDDEDAGLYGEGS